MGKAADFEVGDAVFYPVAGVGRIEAREDIYIGGRMEQCFVVRIVENSAVIKVPQSNLGRNGARRLLDGRRPKELYGVLAAGTRTRRASNWTEYCKNLERIINTGSCHELGAAVRDLLRRKHVTGLSFEEAKLLIVATNHLTREVSEAQGIPPEVAYARIRRHVGVTA
jgi:CarD family transcriptional regulator